MSDRRRVIVNLLATNKKVAAATHNIVDWRIEQQAVTFQDFDDDAEF